MTRSEFLRASLAVAAGWMLPLPRAVAAGRAAYDFWLTRLMYESGDWDVDARMPSNIADALLQYTTLRVDPVEHVLPLSDRRMLSAPFCYLTGHKLVEFSPEERANFKAYVDNGGFVLVDDCNHDIDGLFARSFEAEVATMFGAEALQKLPADHPIYRAFFNFDKPPATGFELNGWGDDLVHDYLKGVSVNGRLGLLYSNKDYGCEWDFDWRNKRFQGEDVTRFAVNIVTYALTT